MVFMDRVEYTLLVDKLFMFIAVIVDSYWWRNYSGLRSNTASHEITALARLLAADYSPAARGQ